MLCFYIFTHTDYISVLNIRFFFLNLFLSNFLCLINKVLLFCSILFKRKSRPTSFQPLRVWSWIFFHGSISNIHRKTLYSTFQCNMKIMWTNSLCRRAGFLCVSATLWSVCAEPAGTWSRCEEAGVGCCSDRCLKLHSRILVELLQGQLPPQSYDEAEGGMGKSPALLCLHNLHTHPAWSAGRV